jgi:hypothetical protein
VTSPLGNFVDAEHDNLRAMVSPVKKIFETFGIEAIIIWVAMVCKKRIFVYSDKPAEVLAVVRAIPLLGAWHRQVCSVVFVPFLNVSWFNDIVS